MPTLTLRLGWKDKLVLDTVEKELRNHPQFANVMSGEQCLTTSKTKEVTL